MKLIADNLRITKPAIQKALKTFDPEPIQACARHCTQKKPCAIDVNTGPLTRNPKQSMQFFIQSIEAVSDLPLVIDTSNPIAMQTGLETAKNPTIINGYSLEPKKLDLILPLAKEFNTDIIGFLLYPDSQVPKDENQRMEVTLELFEKAEACGVPKESIIIDPIIPPLAWDDGITQARSVLKFLYTLPDLLGFNARTIAGVSNLTTGAKSRDKKQLIDANYLAMLASAGLDYALLDIFNKDLVQSAAAADILTRETLFSWGLVPE